MVSPDDHSTDPPRTATATSSLAAEKSPYLLQHASNPVHWYPWGQEAFDRAARENKPIFLSIGYSACHWCHVMAHESFEDPAVAELLNEHFISIKVDREERPDIDAVYMAACQMLTGSGGWPLNVFITPDRKPFYAATYIPKETRFGRIGMLELLPRIASLWESKRGEVVRSAEKVTDALNRSAQSGKGPEPTAELLDAAYRRLAALFDERNGGFGTGPKFPTPHNLLFLIRYWDRAENPHALRMASETLRAIRDGGIYDHIGFGFHRYATDAEWSLPHFEKMLYDQALLALAYLEAYQASRDRTFSTTAREVFTYVMRDMTSPEGAFYTAEDAQSEGAEGKFYLWRQEEIDSILPPEQRELLTDMFGLTPEGNLAGEGEFDEGLNVLRRRRSWKSMSEALGQPVKELRERYERARTTLFDHRNKRPHPCKDDKILADWNGLMIAALARGGAVLGDDGYLDAARRAAQFVLDALRTPHGSLLHRYRDGEAAIDAQADDYAFMIWGLLELYFADFDPAWLREALSLTRVFVDHFWDTDRGGFFLTSDQSHGLPLRQKESYDGALPSANSVAMNNLLRIHMLTGDTDAEIRAHRTARAFSSQFRSAPYGHTHFATALMLALGPSYEVVVAGQRESADTRAMLRSLETHYIPNKVTLFKPDSEADTKIDTIAPWAAAYRPLDHQATAYVCTSSACYAPTTDIREMLALLTP